MGDERDQGNEQMLRSGLPGGKPRSTFPEILQFALKGKLRARATAERNDPFSQGGVPGQCMAMKP